VGSRSDDVSRRHQVGSRSDDVSMTSSGDVAVYKGSTGMMKRQTGGATGGRSADTAVTLAGRITRNRKRLAVSYRTAFVTEAGMSDVPPICCGGGAWRRPDVTL